jgi:hypothetical protein
MMQMITNNFLEDADGCLRAPLGLRLRLLGWFEGTTTIANTE